MLTRSQTEISRQWLEGFILRLAHVSMVPKGWSPRTLVISLSTTLCCSITTRGASYCKQNHVCWLSWLHHRPPDPLQDFCLFRGIFPVLLATVVSLWIIKSILLTCSIWSALSISHDIKTTNISSDNHWPSAGKPWVLTLDMATARPDGTPTPTSELGLVLFKEVWRKGCSSEFADEKHHTWQKDPWLHPVVQAKRWRGDGGRRPTSSD